MLRKRILKYSCDLYPSQTKILEGLTKEEGHIYFRYTFQWFVAQIEYSRPLKVLRKSGSPLLSILPKSSFGRDKLYAPQTTILERGTKEEIRIFEALFKGVSTQFGLRTIEKYIENKYGPPLLSILPKSSFGVV
jgi:hypothetical protein